MLPAPPTWTSHSLQYTAKFVVQFCLAIPLFQYLENKPEKKKILLVKIQINLINVIYGWARNQISFIEDSNLYFMLKVETNHFCTYSFRKEIND